MSYSLPYVQVVYVEHQFIKLLYCIRALEKIVQSVYGSLFRLAQVKNRELIASEHKYNGHAIYRPNDVTTYILVVRKSTMR